MNFTSQICTTKEQSERLLAFGLKHETADMCINPSRELVYPFSYSEALALYDRCGFGRIMEVDSLLPAWSLHRLIEICPLIPNPARFLAVTSFKTVYVRMNDEMDVSYVGKGTYNNLISCIEWLIKEGYFNKDYLEK